MDIKNKLKTNNKNKQDFYIDLVNERYYAFKPELSWFNLKEDDFDLIKKQNEKYEKKYKQEQHAVERKNKQRKEELAKCNESMKMSNIINTVITIFLCCIAAIFGSNDFNLLAALAISFPFVFYFITKKIIYNEVPKNEFRINLKRDKFVDEEKESNVKKYNKAIVNYEKSFRYIPDLLLYLNSSQNVYNIAVTGIVVDPYQEKKEYIDYAKIYFKLLEGYNFYQETDNVFFAEKNNEKHLIYINMIYNRNINMIDEKNFLKRIVHQYTGITNAWMIINCTRSNLPFLDSKRYHDDMEYAVLGSLELSWFLNISLQKQLFNKRIEYYDLDLATINKKTCKEPMYFFYEDGNLKYYGDIAKEKIPQSIAYNYVSNGPGIFLDTNDKILELGNFKKGYIENIQDDITKVNK